MKLFLLRLTLSLHGCIFDYLIVFVLRAVHLIIFEDVNPKKWKKLVDFVKLSFIKSFRSIL